MPSRQNPFQFRSQRGGGVATDREPPWGTPTHCEFSCATEHSLSIFCPLLSCEASGAAKLEPTSNQLKSLMQFPIPPSPARGQPFAPHPKNHFWFLSLHSPRAPHCSLPPSWGSPLWELRGMARPSPLGTVPGPEEASTLAGESPATSVGSL